MSDYPTLAYKLFSTRHPTLPEIYRTVRELNEGSLASVVAKQKRQCLQELLQLSEDSIAALEKEYAHWVEKHKYLIELARVQTRDVFLIREQLGPLNEFAESQERAVL